MHSSPLILRLGIITLGLCGFSSASAQVIIDDFTTASNWQTVMSEGSGALTVGGGTMQFTATTEANTGVVALAKTIALPYASDWSLQVTAHLSELAVPDLNDFADLELALTPAAGSGFSTRLMYQFEVGNWSEGTQREIYTDFVISDIAGSSPIARVGVTSTTVSLWLGYSAATEWITFRYDPDGVANPLTGWITQGRLAIGDGESADFGMTSGDFFSVALVGASEGITIAAGQADFSSLAVTAVPEPSTYAALASVIALGAAGWRRHRQRRLSAAG